MFRVCGSILLILFMCSECVVDIVDVFRVCVLHVDFWLQENVTVQKTGGSKWCVIDVSHGLCTYRLRSQQPVVCVQEDQASALLPQALADSSVPCVTRMFWIHLCNAVWPAQITDIEPNVTRFPLFEWLPQRQDNHLSMLTCRLCQAAMPTTLYIW